MRTLSTLGPAVFAGGGTVAFAAAPIAGRGRAVGPLTRAFGTGLRTLAARRFLRVGESGQGRDGRQAKKGRKQKPFHETQTFPCRTR